MPHGHTVVPSEDRKSRRERDYRTRIMASLVMSLLAVTITLHVPLEQRSPRVGWDSGSPADRIEFNADRSLQAVQTAGGTIATSIGVPVPQPVDSPSDREGSEAGGDQPIQSTVRPLQARETVYEFAQEPPTIRGGLGAYYINIEYPPEAVAKEIEGRLVLRFIVGTDGRAREIIVLQSLHPLCDSAAVRALRQTTFVAGRQNGEKVPVRMQLPVRFRLVGPGQLGSETS